MAIGPEQRAYMLKTLNKAIAAFYGDSVPTLEVFRNKRRKTYMARLEDEVNAASWRAKIAEANIAKGSAQGVVTRLRNERESRSTTLAAKHREEMEALKAKHERERTELVEHYEPALLEAGQRLKEKEGEVEVLHRASYFAALNQEDDNRNVGYYSRGDETLLDRAIRERVDDYIETNLTVDDEGQSVLLRMSQETLVSDAAFIAANMNELRGMVLSFIANQQLPPITVKAWLIESGRDLKAL